MLIVKSWRKGIFLVHFWDFSWLLKDFLTITMLQVKNEHETYYLCPTLNFGLLDSHGNPGGTGIVFLYKPGTDNLNFHLCG